MCLFSRDGMTLGSRGYDTVKGEEFFRIIGGGVHFTETSEVAVRREVREELCTEINDLQLLEVVENIFNYNGRDGHEIIFMYKGLLVDESLYQKEKIDITDGSKNFYAQWISIVDVLSGAKRLYPTLDFTKYLA